MSENNEAAPAEEPVIGDPPPKADVLLSNRAYDWFKRVGLYLLPALGAAYFSIAQIWGLPKPEEVVGTITVIGTLVGVIIKISDTQYQNSDSRFDGQITLVPGSAEGSTALNVSLSPAALASKDEISVKVRDQTGRP